MKRLECLAKTSEPPKATTWVASRKTTWPTVGSPRSVLYEALENELQKRGFLNLYACIAVPIVPDEYLTGNSESFHRHMGYQKVGEFHKCAYKFGRWYSMIWMEKMIGEHI